MRTTYAARDGALLEVDLLGPDGPGLPVLALAGGPARHPDYLGDLAGLASERRVVVPHLRGVGGSPGSDPAQMSYWAQAQDVVALLDALEVESAAVLGHSAGSRLATALALQFPERLAALVLVTPPGAPVAAQSDVDDLVAARAGDPAFDAAVEAIGAAGQYSDDAGYTAWQHAVAPTTYARWGEVEQEHAGSGRWYLGAARGYAGPVPDGAWDRLGEVTAPVLVVLGEQDCATGVVGGQAIARAFRDGRAVVLPNCGHYPWVEQPRAFRAAVDPFLAEVDRRG